MTPKPTPKADDDRLRAAVTRRLARIERRLQSMLDADTQAIVDDYQRADDVMRGKGRS